MAEVALPLYWYFMELIIYLIQYYMYINFCSTKNVTFNEFFAHFSFKIKPIGLTLATHGGSTKINCEKNEVTGIWTQDFSHAG